MSQTKSLSYLNSANVVDATHKPPLKLILSGVLTALLVFVTNSYAAEDDYLKELEEEAHKAAPSNPNDKQGNSNSNSTSNRDLQKFEAMLQSEKPATFRFFNKLSKANKLLVVERYRKDKKISRISKLIIDLYFDSNK